MKKALLLSTPVVLAPPTPSALLSRRFVNCAVFSTPYSDHAVSRTTNIKLLSTYQSFLTSPNPSHRRRTRYAAAPFLAMASSAAPQPSQLAAVNNDLSSSSDVFQTIRIHQERAARLPPVEEVRTFLDRSIRGVLSTFSQDHEGYPSGSMVDFSCDKDGTPILAISSLAVHSKNLLANSKCSLLVAKDPEDRTDTVVTLYGDAIPVPEDDREAARTAYLRRHPDAFWVDFGDFRLVYIKPKFVRYVSGVATALLGSGEFDAEEYKAAKVDPISQFAKPIMTHMNRDHGEDTKAIVEHSTSVKVDFAYMLEVDSLGFNVKAGYQGSTLKLRIPFPRRAEDRKDVKTLLVEMLQAAKTNS